MIHISENSISFEMHKELPSFAEDLEKRVGLHIINNLVHFSFNNISGTNFNIYYDPIFKENYYFTTDTSLPKKISGKSGVEAAAIYTFTEHTNGASSPYTINVFRLNH